MVIDTVIHGSCEEILSYLEPGSVALTVTSPPYWNAVDYACFAENPDQNWKTRKYIEVGETLEEYLANMTDVFRLVRTVTKPGGFCCIVIGSVLFKGHYYPLPFLLTSRLMIDGWQFHQDIVWNKITGGGRGQARAGSLIQKPYPGYYYSNIINEYILIFKREGDPIYRGRTESEKKAAAIPISRLFKVDIANSVWHIAPVPPGHLEHPCPFPEEIPARLISLYSYPGDVVLDPFCGSGQTLKVARHLGRHYIGFDSVDKFVELSRKRIMEPLALRKEQLIARYEKIKEPWLRLGRDSQACDGPSEPRGT